MNKEAFLEKIKVESLDDEGRLCRYSFLINDHRVKNVEITDTSVKPIVVKVTEDNTTGYVVYVLEEENPCAASDNIEAECPGALIMNPHFHSKRWSDVINGNWEYYGELSVDDLLTLTDLQRNWMFHYDIDEITEDMKKDDYYEDEIASYKEMKKSKFNLDNIEDDRYLFLDMTDHSGQWWNISGEGYYCRWDTSPRTAMLILSDYYVRLRIEDHDKFRKEIRRYLDRLSGYPATDISAPVVLNENFEVDDDISKKLRIDGWTRTLETLWYDVKDNKRKLRSEIYDYIEDTLSSKVTWELVDPDEVKVAEPIVVHI